MLVNGIQAMSAWLTNITHLNDVLLLWIAKIPFDWIVIAQQVRETNLWGDAQKAWDHFVRTGQLWAFMIGLFVGYGIKAFTSFG